MSREDSGVCTVNDSLKVERRYKPMISADDSSLVDFTTKWNITDVCRLYKWPAKQWENWLNVRLTEKQAKHSWWYFPFILWLPWNTDTAFFYITPFSCTAIVSIKSVVPLPLAYFWTAFSMIVSYPTKFSIRNCSRLKHVSVSAHWRRK